jgi:hypothetical protein
MDASAFYDLANQIPYYNAYVYSATTSYRLAYLYDTRTVTVNQDYTLFTGQKTLSPEPLMSWMSTLRDRTIW